MATPAPATTPTGIPTSKTKLPAPTKAPSQAQETKAQQASALSPDLLAKIQASLGLTPDQVQALTAGAAGSSTIAQGIQQADAFIKTLQSNPAQLARWTQALTGYNTARRVISNYTQGITDPALQQDTQAVFQLIQSSPQAKLDPWKAVDLMTQSAKSNQLIGDQLTQAATKRSTIMPSYQPASDDEVSLGVENAFQKAYGRNPNARERQTFMEQYKQLEQNRYQQQLGSAQSSTGGGTINQIPTPEGLAYTGIENTPEAIGYNARQGAQVLSSLFKVGG